MLPNRALKSTATTTASLREASAEIQLRALEFGLFPSRVTHPTFNRRYRDATRGLAPPSWIETHDYRHFLPTRRRRRPQTQPKTSEVRRLNGMSEVSALAIWISRFRASFVIRISNRPRLPQFRLRERGREIGAARDDLV